MLSLRAVEPRPAPRIATIREAYSIAEIGTEWVIAGCCYTDDDGAPWWCYLGRQRDDPECGALDAARAAGGIATVTRREADGTRVLLARRVASRPTAQAA